MKMMCITPSGERTNVLQNGDRSALHTLGSTNNHMCIPLEAKSFDDYKYFMNSTRDVIARAKTSHFTSTVTVKEVK